MDITRCTNAEYEEIVRDIADFWGSDRTLHLHQPFLLHEFGDSAFVIRADDRVAAYLFGFLSQTEFTGYVHLIGVRRAYQGCGLGRHLYDRFIVYARAHGCTAIKAITTPMNRASIAFHTRLGMMMQGAPSADGIPVVPNYSGPGQDRVVFRMEI